jgi:methionyl-tRNA synthetase
MSKRDGTFVRAATYLDHLDPSWLRYFFAAKLGPRLDDLDMNLDDFVARVNSDLVGKVVNLASRSAKFVQQVGLSAKYPDDGGLFQQAAEAGEAIAEAYEKCDFNRAMRLIMGLADKANPFVESAEPWNIAKDPERVQELQDVCSVALNLFRQLVIYLSPVLPSIAEKTEQLLGEKIEHWDQASRPLTGTPVAQFEHMMKRVEKKDVDAMIEESKEQSDDDTPEPDGEDVVQDESGDGEDQAETSGGEDSSQPLLDEPLADEISFDEFAKVDLRIARVIEANHVEGADRLLQLTLSLGGDERRSVLAGIKQAYEPEQLVGRLVVMVANLAPRTMRFGTSEGMIAAAGPGAAEVFMLSVDEGAQPGQRVH